MPVPNVDMNKSIYFHLEKVAKQIPTKSAVEYVGCNLSYGKLLSDTVRLANAFLDIGIKKGDRIAIYMYNSPQMLIAYFASSAIGAIVVPINPLYVPREIEHVLKDSGATMVISLDILYEKLRQILPNTMVKNVILTNLGDYLSSSKKVLGNLFRKIPKPAKKVKDVFWLRELLKNKAENISSETSGKDTHAILYTSGTTGVPKGAVLSNKAILYYAMCYNEVFLKPYMKAHPEAGRITGLIMPPLAHILGKSVGIWLLSIGGKAILMPYPNLNGFLNIVANEDVNFTCGVPTMYITLLELDQLYEYLDRIHGKPMINLIGGDKVPVDLYERMEEIIGWNVNQGYASTESGTVFLTPYGDKTIGPLGKINPEADVLVMDAEGEIKRFGEGELLANTPGMMDGYWNLPEENKRAFVEVDGKKYYKTGDIVRITEDGYGYFVDRVREIIKYKGYQVPTGEIEDVLSQHPAIKEAAVIGIADEKVGERIKAYIVLKDDARGITTQEIIKYCRTKLAPYKVPHFIEFRSYLPRGRVGKVLKRKLKEEELLLQRSNV